MDAIYTNATARMLAPDELQSIMAVIPAREGEILSAVMIDAATPASDAGSDAGTDGGTDAGTGGQEPTTRWHTQQCVDGHIVHHHGHEDKIMLASVWDFSIETPDPCHVHPHHPHHNPPHTPVSHPHPQ